MAGGKKEMLMTRSRGMVVIVLVGAVAMAGACGLEALRRNGYFLSDHGRLRLYEEMICDGKGKEGPFWLRCDYFALFIECLGDPNTSLREAAAATVTTNTAIPGIAFAYLVDAYIVGGRDAELKAAVLDAWRREKRNTWARLELANAYLDLRRRQYLWANPEFGKSINMIYPNPRSKWDVWRSFNRLNREAIDARLAELGDKEFDEVRRNYQELMDAHLGHGLSDY
jgi:hypothetical protein